MATKRLSNSIDAEVPLGEQLVRVGNDLSSALTNLLQAVPGAPHNPQELANLLGVKRDTTLRLLTSLRKKDPLAVAHLLPGPEPLRRVTKACEKLGVSKKQIQPAEEAVQALARLIQQEGADRSNLDAVIGEWLPSARARFEGTAKQLGYRAMRQLKGIAADVSLFTLLWYPGTMESRADAVQLCGFIGIRRVRPGARLKLGIESVSSAQLPGHEGPYTLDGKNIDNLCGSFLDQYCSGPEVKVEIQRNVHDVIYTLDWGDTVGVRSKRDIIMGEYRPNFLRRYRTADDLRTRSGNICPITIPSRVQICDFIMHKDIYPNQEPSLLVLELGEHGVTEVNNDSRKIDELNVMESVQPLGNGIDRCRLEQLPDYIDMLRYTCDKRGWDPNAFRAYRCQVEYPIFGTQLQFSFDVPLADSTNK